MKTRSLLVAILLLIPFCNSFSQYAVSLATFNSTADGQSLSFTSPCDGSTHSGFVGLLNCTVDGSATLFYCIDICRSISPGDTIRDSSLAMPRAIYILNNYYPYKTSYPGKLSNNDREAAAIQLAIWNIKHGLVISTVTGDNATQIKTRANAIIADANANGNSTTAVNTIQILPGVGPDEFVIETLDQNGDPIAVNNIQLTISQGSLSTNTVNTNASGLSPEVTVIGTSSGLITAKATAIIPQGMVYASSGHTKQALIIAKPTLGRVEAQTEWGALPVELASFTAGVSGRNVDLKWTTVAETNNAGFKIERSSFESNVWNTIGYVEGNGTVNTTRDYSYVDRSVTSGKYNYRLKQIDFNGNFEYHNLTSEIEIGTPSKFDLSQNYPNPFNPTTKINYDLSFAGLVSLNVFDMSGKQILAVVNEQQSAGYYSVTINAGSIASGVYYYRLTASGEGKNFVATKKMILVK